jgi:asparagine synthase (glutamine-hydrolysing)
MCGFAGMLSSSALLAEAATRHATAMADAIRHRGPDDKGTWVDDAAGEVLAHRRFELPIEFRLPEGRSHAASGC